MERFSEVVQEYASSTNGGLGITGSFFEELTAYFLFADGLFTQEFRQAFDVFDIKVCDTASFASVASYVRFPGNSFPSF